MLKVKQSAKLENLENFKDSLHGFLVETAVPESKIPDIELAIEELIVNVMSYSYPENEGQVELIGEEKTKYWQFKIIDNGIIFDPTTAPNPNLNAPLSDRSKGGMGIFLAKQLLDELQYQREDQKNILTLIVKK